MSKTTLEILKGARGHVQSGWTQRAFARDETGKVVSYAHREACQFCMAGAIMRESGLGVIGLNPAGDIAWRKLQDVVGISISQYNDTHTQEEVLTVFDKAIAALEAEYAKSSSDTGESK